MAIPSNHPFNRSQPTNNEQVVHNPELDAMKQRVAHCVHNTPLLIQAEPKTRTAEILPSDSGPQFHTLKKQS